MKIQKIIFAVVVACLVLTSCKNETKKEDTSIVSKEVKSEQLALNISGMTCQMGCANKIQKDLAKKEGVLDAKVVFSDSIATINFDANKTNKADLIAFVDGIAGGDIYKASENTTYKMCDKDCKKECCTKTEADKKACAEDCKKDCCADKKT